MEPCLLGLHLGYKFLDAVHGCLIANGGANSLVTLDLSVEFFALFTHESTAFARWQ